MGLHLQPQISTYNQAEILLEIADHEGLTISQLEGRTGVTKSNLSTLITKLEMRDLVERRRDSSDRHYVHIYLTPYSRSIVETLRREMNVAKELSLGFSPPEQAVVTQLLQRLSDQNKVTA